MNKVLFVGIVAAFVIVALAVNAEPSLIILIIIFSSALSALLLLPQRVVQNEVKTFVSLIVDGILLTIVLACWIGLQDADGVTSSILIGFGAMAGLYLLRRHIFKPLSNGSWMAGQKKTTFANISKWHISPNDGDIRTAILKWREDDADEEFVFRGLRLPCSISETRFTEFIRIAVRRQINAYYGTKWSMQEVGDCKFRRLKPNEILSREHYLKRCRPRWLIDEYWACIMILSYAQLLEKKGQGDAGRLSVRDKSIQWYVNKCKQVWLGLQERMRPQSMLGRIFSRN